MCLRVCLSNTCWTRKPMQQPCHAIYSISLRHVLSSESEANISCRVKFSPKGLSDFPRTLRNLPALCIPGLSFQPWRSRCLSEDGVLQARVMSCSRVETWSSEEHFEFWAKVRSPSQAYSTSSILMSYRWLSKLWPPFGSLNTRCRIILRTQEGTMILTTTHIWVSTHRGAHKWTPVYCDPYSKDYQKGAPNCWKPKYHPVASLLRGLAIWEISEPAAWLFFIPPTVPKLTLNPLLKSQNSRPG